MKDSFYFPHDYHARHDEKMLFIKTKYGIIGYGIYWILIEMMHEQNDGKLTCNLMDGIATEYNIDITLLKGFFDDAIKVGLFITDNNKYWSARVIKNKRNLELKRKRHSIAGKLGMASRWGKTTKDNNVITADNKVKESKVKEIKETKTEHLFFKNLKFQTIFKDYLEMRSKIRRPATDKAISLILAKLEKYSIETAIKMLEQSVLNSWQGVFELKQPVDTGAGSVKYVEPKGERFDPTIAKQVSELANKLRSDR